MVRFNKAKQRLKNGEPVFGTTISLHDPAVGEIMGYSGFDFVFIDNEHVSMDRNELTNIIRSTEISDTVPIVRVKAGYQEEILQMLDLGALGVQVPNVNTAEQAEAVAKSARYTPLGCRGLGTTNRSTGYGHLDRFKYFEMANENILTVLQCESVEAISNLKEIASVANVDVIFIGAMDLSQTISPEAFGRRNHPDVVKMFNESVKLLVDMGHNAGAAVGNVAEAEEMIKMGVKYVCISGDIPMINQVSVNICSDMKKLLGR